MGKTPEEFRKKAIKLLKKKGNDDPSEKQIAKKIKKLEAKAAAKADGSDDEAESPKKREAEEEVESSSKKAKTEEAAPAAASSGSAVGAVGPPWKCFLGNLSYDIDDDQCKAFFKDCGGEVTDLFWLQDKETQKFFGAGFITFDTPEAQVAAVAMNGQELLGRPVKIEFAKPKAGGATPGKKEYPKKEMSEKPDGCVQIFCGNLSYDIDDDATKAFFKDCGEIKAIRWLTDRESGDFKGCGFIEFYEEGSVDKAALLNGKDLLGRSIRIDFAKQREKKEW